MAKEPLTPRTPKSVEPGIDPQRDPQPYTDPVKEPPNDPPDERPLINPTPPNTDLPRMFPQRGMSIFHTVKADITASLGSAALRTDGCEQTCW